VDRNDQAGIRLLRRLREKDVLCHIVRFSQTGNAEEKNVRPDAVQLPFDVIEAGTDQDLLLPVLDVKVVGAALLVIPQACGLDQRFLDRYAQIIRILARY